MEGEKDAAALKEILMHFTETEVLDILITKVRTNAQKSKLTHPINDEYLDKKQLLFNI